METAIIQEKIYQIRGEKIMLDFDLAGLYDVETKALNQAVKRNITRFPEDFMFQLTPTEYKHLKSQIVTSSWGGPVRFLSPLPSMALPCWQAFYAAKKPSISIS